MKQRRKQIAVALIASALAGTAIYFGLHRGDDGVAAPLQAVPGLQGTPPPPPDLVPEGAPARGDEDAKVTIVEFSDFDCEFCARHARETLPSIFRMYGEKIRYIFRYYPLADVNPLAPRAAYAAECANRQGRFWPYHDQLFAHRGEFETAYLREYAKASGLRVKEFDRCMKNGDSIAAVERDLADAQRLGIVGTPSFLINGETTIGGAQPIERFRAVIDPLL